MRALQFKQSVINVPDRDWPSAVVVYGGLYGWEGAWLLKKIPLAVQQSVVLVLPKHYTNKLKDCLDELHAQIKPENISSYSLCGFSRGGVEVYRYRAAAEVGVKDWKILGLIDATAPTMAQFPDTVLDSVKNKVRCVYWVPHWTDYGDKVPNFAKHLRDIKVNIVEEQIHHADMPKLFFDRFKSDFVT
jgi:hypothetical protein